MVASSPSSRWRFLPGPAGTCAVPAGESTRAATLPDFTLQPLPGAGVCLRHRPGSAVSGTVIEADVGMRTEPTQRSEAILADGQWWVVEVPAGPLAVDDPALITRLTGCCAPVDSVFLYGTLMQGESNSEVLRAEWVQERVPATVSGTLHETCHPYPVLRLDGGQTVKGERVRLHDVGIALGPLDALEGFTGYGQTDRMYRRTLVHARSADGTTSRCWTYVQGETLVAGPAIAGGDWRGFRLRATAGRLPDAP